MAYELLDTGAMPGAIKLGKRTIRVAIRPFFEEYLGEDLSWHEGSPHRGKTALRAQEAAEVLRVGLKMVRQEIKVGNLPGGRVVTKSCFRITSKSFFEWLDTGQKPLSSNSK